MNENANAGVSEGASAGANENASANVNVDASSWVSPSQPVKIILDTDIGPDCDDAGALAVLHALADRGEAEIVGVMHNTSSPWGAGCIDAISAYYGRPSLPIGTLKDEGFLVGEPYEKYNKYVSQHYPNRYPDGSGVPDATALFRKLLAAEPDRDVTVVGIGPLRNLRLLLESGPDEASPLDGEALVAAKVQRLVVMGGAYPSGEEWNFQMDPASASQVCERWPTPILFCGFEIGENLLTGGRMFEELPIDHPVRQAYALFLDGKTDRSSWDLITVLCAVRGFVPYWDIEAGGKVDIDERGGNVWRQADSGNHAYLKPKLDPIQAQRLLDELLVWRP